MAALFALRPCLSSLEREQAFDVRRSVLCGELHLGREAAHDADDASAQLVLAYAGEKPVGTGRLLSRGDQWLLEHLAVLPPYRRKGLGRLLVGYFEAAARDSGAADLVAVAPRSASAFFIAVGYGVEKEESDVTLLRRQL